MRLAFFGTPAFAVPTLEAIFRSSHRVAVVVTQPDRPRGRGQRRSPSPVKELATRAGVTVLEPERLADDTFVATLRAQACDLGIVAAYGRILPETVLAAPRLGMVNVHASLLPRYRGAAPVHRAVIAGERETGISIMHVVKALDAGPVYAQATRHIGPDETSEEVERGLATLGASLLVESLDGIARDALHPEPQDEARATYAPRLTREDGRVEWERSATRVHNLVRGLHPWPLAETRHRGTRLIIRRTALDASGSRTDERPGTIVHAAADVLRVACGEGSTLRLVEVQREGRRPLPARDFIAGRQIAVGDHLTTARP